MKLHSKHTRIIFSCANLFAYMFKVPHFNDFEKIREVARTVGNLQSYWTTTKLWKLAVVLDYYEAMETYSRIGLLRSYGNLQSYWTATKLLKLTVVLDYYEPMETYSRIDPHRLLFPLLCPRK